jgi:unsaturated rhamnogalacturonyl hydrolase
MTTIELLDLLPTSHPQRAAMLSTLRKLVAGLVKVQDPVTGLWFQVVDKGSNLDNWHETSCSSMHAYVILRAVQEGYVDASFMTAAEDARLGVMTKLFVGPDGRANISGICIGTNVGNLAFYLARPKATNDMHGLGAFLIMNEAFDGNFSWNPDPPPLD